MARISSIEEIKNAAQYFFAEKGYEATSLYDIAQKVGLRKQSIYAHFKNKDDLFICIIERACKEEINNTIKLLDDRHSDAKSVLQHFISDIKTRYIQNDNNNLKIVLRSAYFPPEHLKEQSIRYADNYFSEIRVLLFEILKASPQVKVETNVAVEAFMTILDGLFICLVAINESRFDQKFYSSWSVFWRGVS